MPEGVRSAPNRAKRPQASGMQDVQELEFWVDSFGAFHVKDSCQHAILHALADFADATTEANPALRLCLNPKQQRDHAESDASSRR